MENTKRAANVINSTESIQAECAEEPSLNARIAGGDEQALALVVGRYSAPVFRFLARMVGSDEEAQDLTQETFYSFYLHREKLRLDVDIHPYLFTIARRKAISHLRWRKVRSILTPFTPEHENTFENQRRSPADRLLQKRTEAEVQNALNRIHPEKRTVLILRFFEEQSYSDIARIMNKPLGTVKSLAYRGERELRSRLAHCLEREEGER
ncbi:MAG: RNA polymerase sigma factor [Candidatus Omnitrophica bacterium]|nr:RNA polymerase sigma factor [Candidatus Omnitrophota bacterium]